jgi:hypothetical protein
VSVATDITQIGVLNDLTSDGHLKFLIFDSTTNTLLFETGSQAFVDDGFTFKLSSPFAAFTLLPGMTYAIGAIADVSGGWGTNNSSAGNPFTQNGITTSDDFNRNVSNFVTPVFGVDGFAMIGLELAGTPTPTVPEPGTLLLLASGLIAAAGRRRMRGV